MNGSSLTSRKLALAGFLICAGLIGFALYLQYGEHLEPCPLCMMQRILFGVLGLLFLLAAIHGPNVTGVRLYALLQLIVAGTGLGFATRHVWLQWYPPENETCSADLFFQLHRFPILRVVERALQATGDCAKVDWTFLGLSIAQWSWIWFLIFVIATLWMLVRPVVSSRRHRRAGSLFGH